MESLPIEVPTCSQTGTANCDREHTYTLQFGSYVLLGYERLSKKVVVSALPKLSPYYEVVNLIFARNDPYRNIHG